MNFKINLRIGASIDWPIPPADKEQEAQRVYINTKVNKMANDLEPLISQLVILLIEKEAECAKPIEPQKVVESNPFA